MRSLKRLWMLQLSIQSKGNKNKRTNKNLDKHKGRLTGKRNKCPKPETSIGLAESRSIYKNN